MRNRGVIIGLIIFLSLLCVSLIAGMIILMNKDIGFSFGINLGAERMKLVDTFEEDGSNINEIELNLFSSNVEIKESDSNLLKIEYYSNKETDNVIKMDENKVVVDEEDSKLICLGICTSRKKTVIYVPTNYVGSYNINTTSGDVKSNISTMENDITIKTTSGDILLKNLMDVTITTTSGDIEIGSAREAALHTTSGDINIRSDVKTLEAGTTSGDIKVFGINKRMTIGSTSGYIAINNLSIVEDSSINTISGDIKVDNNESDCYVEFSTISGRNHIEKSNRKSDIVLKVNTISGDIRIN